MATDCDSLQIKYQGDGTRVLFPFPFTYMNYDDIVCFIYNENTKVWVNQANKFIFANATTVEFLTPPPAPEDTDLLNVWITRQTDISQMIATFYPGSSIRAQDLNDDFDQLRLAIEESKCAFENFEDNLSEDFVSKQKLFDRDDQETGKWEDDGDQEYVATSGAIAARSDTIVGDTLPPTITYQQPGKGWQQTDPCYSSYWNQEANAWVAYVNTGPRGVPGTDGANADVQIGVTTTGEPGTDASVIDTGSGNIAVLNFTIPRGDKGEKGDGLTLDGIIDVPGPPTSTCDTEGETIMDSDGNLWVCDGNGTWVDAGVLQGEKGDKGDPGDPGLDGDAATINIDNTITGDPGTEANVINTGSNTAANLIFTIPKGEKGDPGDLGLISTFPPLP